MPVECGFDPCALPKEEFRAIDYKITGLVYNIHNKFGRMHVEKVYQNEFAARCRAAGYEARREVPITVSFQDFSKTYYMDVLVNDAIDYELKVVKRISGQHESQTLNYLMLSGLTHGKLFNFGGRSVEFRFVSTRYTLDRRRELHYEDDGWAPKGRRCQQFRQALRDLLADVGGHLEVGLYREALSKVLGGPDGLERTLEVHHEGRPLGGEAFAVLDDRIALEFTALTESLAGFKRHLIRKYALIDVDVVHWVNFEDDIVTIMTLDV